MMMHTPFERQQRRAETGSALIFALGMLSLLLILALLFSSDMLLSRKSAANSSYHSSANILAKSAVNQTALALQQYQLQQAVINSAAYNQTSMTDTAPAYPTDFSAVSSQYLKPEADSADATAAAGGENDGLDKLLPVSSVYEKVELKNADNDASDITANSNDGANSYASSLRKAVENDPLRSPKWVYVTGANNEIVGRYAFRVHAPLSTNQLNLGSYVKGDPEFISSKLGNGAGDITYETSQLNLDRTLASMATAPATGGILYFDDSLANDRNLVKAGNLSAAEAAGPFEFFRNGYPGRFKTGSDRSSDHVNWFLRHFSDGRVPADLEVFKAVKDGREFYYHRYPLSEAATGNNSDAAVKKLLGLDANTPVEPLVFDNIEPKNGDFSARRVMRGGKVSPGNLFLLNNIADNPASFADLASRRSQIAANLLDYCDSDNIPTSDVPVKNWKPAMTTLPSYTGNERTLYINEFAVGFNSVATVADKSVTLVLNPSVAVELADIYGVGNAGRYKVDGRIEELKLKFLVTVNYGTLGLRTSTQTVEVQFNPFGFTIIGFPDVENGYTAQTTPSLTAKTQKIDFSSALGNNAIKRVSITVLGGSVKFAPATVLSYRRSLLSYDNVDLVKMPQDTFNLNELRNLSLLSSLKLISTCFWIGGMQAKDPRQNLNINIQYAGLLADTADWQKSDWIFMPTLVKSHGKFSDLETIVSWISNVLNLSSISQRFDNLIKNIAGFISTPVISMQLKEDVTVSTALSGGMRNNLCGNPSLRAFDVSIFPSLIRPEQEYGTGDNESAADPAYLGVDENQHLSTAVIRNAPMQSLWELGFIHRGAAWETINLKSSKLDSAALGAILAGNDFAGTAYNDGDAAILDVVKLGDSPFSYGMIDINALKETAPGYNMAASSEDAITRDSMLLEEALANQVGAAVSAANSGTPWSYNFETISTGTAAQMITDEQCRTIAGNLTDNYDLRSQALPFLTETGLVDARAEELAGKVMPLLKTTPAMATVIYADVVAQTIRDSGGVMVRRLQKDGTLSDPVETVSGVFDQAVGSSGETLHLDDITAQTRIRAVFDCNPYTGKVVLRQIRYLP